MNHLNNPKLTANSQSLQKNMPKEERHLWYDFLKSLPVAVRRQKVIGNYIVDFCIPSGKIIIELDGSQHYEPAAQDADRLRDAFLKGLGYTVLRYTNADISLRFGDVCEDILRHLSP